MNKQEIAELLDLVPRERIGVFLIFGNEVSDDHVDDCLKKLKAAGYMASLTSHLLGREIKVYAGKP